MDFQLTSRFHPTGDQPQAIEELVRGFQQGLPYQTLLGVTGSGKTFTAANVIAQVKKPTLVLSHNKTLAAQLYAEFKAFFPNNAVEYFVSYYDYYQPEAYIAASDTYIEKDMAINAEIEKLRLRTTASLLSGREDVIVVSSVSCLYGMADPKAFEEKIIRLSEGDHYSLEQFKRDLVLNHYVNDRITFESGYFRVKGDTIDVFPAIEGFDGVAYRITFWDDEIERIASFDPQSGREYGPMSSLIIHPANLFVTTQEQVNTAVGQIDVDLGARVAELEAEDKPYEAKRLYERTTYDLEMIRELGYCSGIENYSRYFDGRKPGERPFCLLDYFPKDFLLIIDESHVTVPQIHAMYGGDRSRKISLVEHGFRLPAALDNRPLTFEEFDSLTPRILYISATPAEYELAKSEGGAKTNNPAVSAFNGVAYAAKFYEPVIEGNTWTGVLDIRTSDFLTATANGPVRYAQVLASQVPVYFTEVTSSYTLTTTVQLTSGTVAMQLTDDGEYTYRDLAGASASATITR